MTAGERLSASQDERLAEARRLVTEPGSTPGVDQLARGVEYLEALVAASEHLDHDTRKRIADVRMLYVRKLVASPDGDETPSVEAQLDRAALLLTRLRPEVDGMRSAHRRNAALRPTPPDGATAEISPPGLAWSPVPRATSYLVEIRDDTERTVHRTTVHETVHLPPMVLPAGSYWWNVTALDRRGEPLADRGWFTVTVPAGVPALPWIEPEALLARLPAAHPRFLYLESELPELRASLDTTRRRSWADCLAAATRAQGTPPPDYPSYHGSRDDTEARLGYRAYHAHLRDVVEGAMMDLALAYLMTEDERYAAHAKRILLSLTEWPTADDDVTSVRSTWGDEPGLIVARSAHRAYDWLHPALDDDERLRVRTMCEARADQALRRLRALDYLAFPGESHGARLVAYLVEMAIVMPQAAGAPDWLDYGLKALTTVCPHWGGVDGGWAEGISYGRSYGRIHLPALESLRKTTGYDLWSRPFFTKARDFFLYCSSPRGELSPFGDGAERGGPGRDKTASFARFMTHQAHRFDDAHAGWWVDQLPEFESSGEDALLFEDALPIRPPTDLPNARQFRGVGWAALHSDLARPESDTLLLLKSSPFGSVSHSHADQNAFAVLKGGAALAIPSGHAGPLSGMPHHTEWTCSTRASNTVLVDGEGQPVRDSTATGRIAAFWDDAEASYVAGDASDAYAGRLARFVRHVLFLRPGLFVMLDELRAPRPARFQWMLHTLQEMEVDEDRGRVVSRRSGATMDLRLRSTEELRFAQTDRFAVPYDAGAPEWFHEEVADHWHLTAETVDPVAATRIGAVVAVTGPDEHVELEQLDHPGWIGARASGDFGAVEGWMQLRVGAPGPDAGNGPVADGTAILGGTTASGAPVAVGPE